MKSIFFFILLGLSFPIFANETCYQVSEGYEDSNEMYVICNNLSTLNLIEKNNAMKAIMEQYQGEPGEIVVYFISSKNAVGKTYNALSAKEFVGLYDTNDNILTLWPKIASRQEEMFLEWESSF